jgi:hypothetical protein
MVADLIARHATAEEVVRHLGEPEKRARDGNAKESMEYRSVKRRVAYETTLGIRHSVTSQDFVEMLELSFDDGHLVGAKRSSKTMQSE